MLFLVVVFSPLLLLSHFTSTNLFADCYWQDVNEGGGKVGGGYSVYSFKSARLARSVLSIMDREAIHQLSGQSIDRRRLLPGTQPQESGLGVCVWWWTRVYSLLASPESKSIALPIFPTNKALELVANCNLMHYTAGVNPSWWEIYVSVYLNTFFKKGKNDWQTEQRERASPPKPIRDETLDDETLR